MKMFKEKRIVSLTFCDNKYIKNLNKTYRRKNEPTDVLSFPMKEYNLLGDIVISVDYADNTADEYNISFSKEIENLAVHGLLHLLGLSHKKMEEIGCLWR